MARLKAADIQYTMNVVPPDVWNITFAEGRDMINFYGGLQPLPKNMSLNDNGVNIPIYYSQNSSFVSYTEDDVNPAAGHATYKYYTQPFKRYHGTTGIDGLIAALKEYGGYGPNNGSEIAFQMQDLMSSGLTALNDDLALDGSGNSGYDVQGVLYHVSNTGTWNGTNKAITAHLQSYISSNSGTDRDLTKTLIDTVVDTMRTTRRVRFDVVAMGDEAYHAYEQLYADYRHDNTFALPNTAKDLYVQPYDVDGRPVVRLPIDTNYMLFLRRSDWGLYYLPRASYTEDRLHYSEGPWEVEQIGTGYDASDFVLRMYVTLICRNPWAQAGLFDVQPATT